jgi:hypothetical protein
MQYFHGTMEVFESDHADTCDVSSIISHCEVLSLDDYLVSHQQSSPCPRSPMRRGHCPQCPGTCAEALPVMGSYAYAWQMFAGLLMQVNGRAASWVLTVDGSDPPPIHPPLATNPPITSVRHDCLLQDADYVTPTTFYTRYFYSVRVR